MPAAVYPLLLLLVVFVLGSAFFKSELFGHFLLLAFAMILMLVINHYTELYVWGLAYQARSPWLRYFLANSAITAASIAPAVVLGLIWLVRYQVHSFALYAAATATATSGLVAAYGEVLRLATLLSALFAPRPDGLHRSIRRGRRGGADGLEYRRAAQGPHLLGRAPEASAPRRLGAARRKQLAADRGGQGMVQARRHHHRRGLSSRSEAQARR
jgi:hypothetical protein